MSTPQEILAQDSVASALPTNGGFTNAASLPRQQIGGLDPGADLSFGRFPIGPLPQPVGPAPAPTPVFPAFPTLPSITAVQPSQLNAGGTTTVTASGSFPPNAQYSVVDFSGRRLTEIVVALRSYTTTQVLLDITVPPTIVSGYYYLRAEVLGAAAQFPILVNASKVIRIDSISPTAIYAGFGSSVTVFGANLPGDLSDYSVVGFNGLPVAGVHVLFASGMGSQVMLIIGVDAGTPSTSAFLRLSVPGTAIQVPLSILGR